MTAFVGKKSDIYITSGASVAYPANDPLSDVSANVPGALVRTVYQVTATARRYFDTIAVPAFQRSLDSGATWNAVTPDFVDAGTIRFIASQQAAPAAQFRVSSGNYLPYARVGGGNEWGVTAAIDIYDATEFMNTSKHHVVGVDATTIQLKRFWLDDSVRSLIGTKFVLILFIDATTQPTGPRYEVLATMKDDQIKTPVKGTIDEAINFESETELILFSA